MRKIVINGNKVENIIEADDNFILDNRTIIDDVDGVNIGDLYINGKFEKDLLKIEDEKRAQMSIEAKSLLQKSDMVALRCLKAKIDFPNEWSNFVLQLRQVINGELNEMPSIPDYPEGS